MKHHKYYLTETPKIIQKSYLILVMDNQYEIIILYLTLQ